MCAVRAQRWNSVFRMAFSKIQLMKCRMKVCHNDIFSPKCLSFSSINNKSDYLRKQLYFSASKSDKNHNSLHFYLKLQELWKNHQTVGEMIDWHSVVQMLWSHCTEWRTQTIIQSRSHLLLVDYFCHLCMSMFGVCGTQNSKFLN